MAEKAIACNSLKQNIAAKKAKMAAVDEKLEKHPALNPNDPKILKAEAEREVSDLVRVFTGPTMDSDRDAARRLMHAYFSQLQDPRERAHYARARALLRRVSRGFTKLASFKPALRLLDLSAAAAGHGGMAAVFLNQALNLAGPGVARSALLSRSPPGSVSTTAPGSTSTGAEVAATASVVGDEAFYRDQARRLIQDEVVSLKQRCLKHFNAASECVLALHRLRISAIDAAAFVSDADDNNADVSVDSSSLSSGGVRVTTARDRRSAVLGFLYAKKFTDLDDARTITERAFGVAMGLYLPDEEEEEDEEYGRMMARLSLASGPSKKESDGQRLNDDDDDGGMGDSLEIM
ncbi:hypothetical protein HK101_001509 [Irineochytrium annulatum]|nr:hypothetical protein HK101_001509 [Irineochytrium annulatum]